MDGVVDQETICPDREKPPAIAVVGTVIMFSGAVLLFAMLTVVDNVGGVEKPSRDVTLPAMFYVNRPMWYGLAAVLILAGVVMQKAASSSSPIKRPVFRSVVVFTRKDCHLCDDAKVTLLKWSEYLPTILDVDIDDDPELVEQFGDCVPVVEIDGKIRFRGNVSEVLLKRLVEAAQRAEFVTVDSTSSSSSENTEQVAAASNDSNTQAKATQSGDCRANEGSHATDRRKPTDPSKPTDQSEATAQSDDRNKDAG